MRADFYARDVVSVARELVGCVLRHGQCSGIVVETEAYHVSEPACHAYVGRTPRTRVLFGPPGRAYVYRSYGIHALLNAVAEPENVGAAVLIRALEPVGGISLMRARRGLESTEDLCGGPGRLTQALGIGLELNDSELDGGPIVLERPTGDARSAVLVAGPRVGITKAVELPWRFCARGSRFVSRPWPAGLDAPRRRPVRRTAAGVTAS